ncbi:MAG TPA: anti-sigma factor [Candidatus Limnocylindrales bacterium]
MATMTCDRVREFASGFVLGALETDEMIAVQDHLDSCPKAHPEVHELGGVLPYLAESLEPVESPAWLRKSVIEAAKSDLTSRRLSGEPFARRVAAPVAAAAPARVISLNAARASRRRRAAVWFGRAAAAALIVVVAGYAAVVQTGVGKPSGTDEIWNVLGQPDARPAVLVAYDHSQAGGLAVLRPSGNIIVSVHNLQPTKGDEVYVVWLTADNGVPSKVGSFTVDDSGVGKLNVDGAPISESLWIFVCKEPNSNVTKPTGPTIVSGTISL